MTKTVILKNTGSEKLHVSNLCVYVCVCVCVCMCVCVCAYTVSNTYVYVMYMHVYSVISVYVVVHGILN